jgi:polyphosphate kinase 2 (PPK2 family)
MSYIDKFKVKPGTKIDLSAIDPDDTDVFAGKRGKIEAKDTMRLNLDKINALQECLYAQGEYSLLLVMQAMDAAGKDGTISKVFGAMNPQGTRTVSFKKPTELELSHDPFWRIHRHTPAKGHAVIFNRSHYEEALIVKVKSLVPEKAWKNRMSGMKRSICLKKCWQRTTPIFSSSFYTFLLKNS